MGDVLGVATEAATKANVIKFRMKQIARRPYDSIIRDGIRQFNAGSKRPL